MLDDLRRSALDDDTRQPVLDDDLDAMFERSKPERRRFLGMTPIERMFIAIFFFMNVVVIGLALLLATGRIVF